MNKSNIKIKIMYLQRAYSSSFLLDNMVVGGRSVYIHGIFIGFNDRLYNKFEPFGWSKYEEE